VISLPSDTKVWLAAGVTDLRRGMDGLAALVQMQLNPQPYSGHVFVFRGGRGDLLKVLWADRDGLCLFAKRLERGRFVWPQAASGAVHLTPAQLAHKTTLVESLTAEVLRLRRWTFGRSAEKVDLTIAPELPLNGAVIAPSGDAPAAAPALPSAPPRLIAVDGGSGRSGTRRAPRDLPPELPRVVRIHEPASCQCPDCGSAMRRLGEDASEQLDHVPDYFQVIRHVRPKLACAACARIVQAAAPSRPIERGLPTAALLAQVIGAKYADHCPLYRQEGIYRRAGVELHARHSPPGWGKRPGCSTLW
jgi:transposase